MDWKLGRLAAAAAFTVAFAAPAAPAPADVLGISLGQPLPLPECESEKKFGQYRYKEHFTESPPLACWRERLTGPKTGVLPQSGELRLVLPWASVPAGINWEMITLTMVDGKAERLVALTRGQKYQRELLDSLREKYGAPTEIEESTFSNAMGAKFPVIVADWKRDNIFVTFAGMAGRSDQGVLAVETPAGQAARAQNEKSEKAAAPKL